MKEFCLEEIPGGNGILWTSRIVVFGLAMGVFAFGLVTTMIVVMNPQNGVKDQLPIVSCIMAFLGASTLLMSFIVPNLAVAQTRRQVRTLSSDDQAQAFLQVFPTKTIIGSACCEGGAFANLIAVIVEQQWWSFGIAGVMLLSLLSRFPTAAGIENFVQQQVELAELERGRGE